jgi:hypothetical protein
MHNWSWKEGFRFALAEQFIAKEGYTSTYKMSAVEKFGSQFLGPLYKIITLLSKHIRKPLAICLATMLAALFTALVFYNVPAFVILGKLFPSKIVRYVIFLYIELNIFAMGCRAFGRFNNKALIKLWKKGQLMAILPGDQKLFFDR